MVADSYSDILGYLVQGTGNNNNNWGDKANASVFEVFERAIAGRVAYAVTGGVTDISGTTPPSGISSAVDYIHYFSGTLATDQQLVVPNVEGTWLIHNNTVPGTFAFSMRTDTGVVSINIPHGGFTLVYCDGNDVLYRSDSRDVGSVVMSAGITNPLAGTMACNGASLLRSRFPDLFNVIGTTYGAADGLHFNLPDLVTSNRFPRAAGGAITLGQTATNQNASHTHNITGVPAVGTLTAGSNGAHTHGITDPGHDHTLTNFVVDSTTVGGAIALTLWRVLTGTPATSSEFTGISINSDGAHTHNVTGTLTAGTLAVGTTGSGGSEARPNNMALYFCIKY